MKISNIQQSLFEEVTQDNSIGFKHLCDSLSVEVHKPNWADDFGSKLFLWAKENVPCISTLSLFSGAGGLDIGFHDAGFQIKQMVEIEPKFAATLIENTGKSKYFEESDVFNGDIKNYAPPSDLKIDFIIGGPPCQTFSAAGRRAAGVKGTSDEKGQLFEEYIRLIKTLKPKGFLFENVYGITGAENGQAWAKISEAFGNIGYKITARILDSADYGIAQHRERMFIIGSSEKPYKFPFPTHGPDSVDALPYITAKQVLHKIEEIDFEKLGEVNGRYGHLLKQIPDGLNYSFFTAKLGNPSPIFAWRSKFSDFLYKADPDMPVRTLKAQIGQYSGPFHWQNRPFTIAEFKRLQTFPDNYKISGGRQTAIHQIGNSVTPQIARILAMSILDQLFDVKLPSQLLLMDSNQKLGFRKRKLELTKIYAEKAKSAITSLGLKDPNYSKNTKSVISKSKNYSAKLTSDFILLPTSENGSIKIQISKENDFWRIQALPKADLDEKVFSIKVEPFNNKGWEIPIRGVELKGVLDSRESFISVWKAFEKELVETNLKADLVQLCGYYQYKPSFICHMKSEGQTNLKEWQVLKKIVEGVGIARLISYKEICELWEISYESILPIAKWLRTMAYEIRNNKTNSQIPEHYLLIPYSFPTLTAKSVQLRKSLD